MGVGGIGYIFLSHGWNFNCFAGVMGLFRSFVGVVGISQTLWEWTALVILFAEVDEIGQMFL